MNRFHLSLLVSAAVFAAGGVASAGFKLSTGGVTINGNQVSGSIGDARNAPDANQFIGCHVFRTGNAAPILACYGRDVNMTYKVCTTTDEVYVGMAHGISDSSYLSFVVDASGNCSFLDVRNDSMIAPKTP